MIVELIIENYEELTIDELEWLKELSLGFEEINGEFQISIISLDILDLICTFKQIEFVKDDNKIDCFRVYLYNDEV